MFTINPNYKIDFDADSFVILRYKNLQIEAQKAKENDSGEIYYAFYAVQDGNKTCVGNVYPTIWNYPNAYDRIYNAVFDDENLTFWLDNITYHSVDEYADKIAKDMKFPIMNRFNCSRIFSNHSVKSELTKDRKINYNPILFHISEILQYTAMLIYRHYYKQDTIYYLKDHHKNFYETSLI